MIFVISVVAIMVPVLIGIVLAFAAARVDVVVAETKAEIENKDRAFNPAVTLGHKIKLDADVDEQLQEARRLAAKRAAALPRGANMRIGRLGHENLRTASEALEQDPLSAVRIAAFHGWDGARVGAPAGGVPAAPAAAPVAAPAAAPAADGKIELVPGRDYPVIEITDDMSGPEKRKARIANAKAKSAALKAAKEAGAVPSAPAAAAAPAAPAAAPAARPAAPAVPAGIPEPEYIEITDDMPPEEVRKARIHNAKAKSAYNKALKAAGIDPSAVEAGEAVAPAAAPEPAVAAAAPAPAAPAGLPSGIEPPNLIVITDDMSPDEIRSARIANSKAKSAFNKALKAAGIDPSTIDIDETGKIVMTTPAKDPTAGPAATSESPRAATPAEPTPATMEEPVAVPAGIPKPDYIDITDDMSPEEVRRARIHNAKERSAYNKALKAAGIDPKSIPEP